MHIGIPKEIKSQEFRVGLIPGSVRELHELGHTVSVETLAGDAIGFTDEMYQQAGATILDSAEAVFKATDMIVKVKEPQPSECRMLREGQVLFTYLHLAPDPEQTRLLKESGCSAIAYETVTADDGSLPLLTPMSQVAGRMSVQAGAHSLEKQQGGSGMLLGGVPGVKPAEVVVIGGGVVGTNAIRMAIGMEASVTVLDRSLPVLKILDAKFKSRLNTIYATYETTEEYVSKADLLIGAVLVTGAAAPKLVTRKMLQSMHPGSVFVDVAIDQGGCGELSKPTAHDHPTYTEEGVVHYCVANMPGAVPQTSTVALNNATLPFVIQLANRGLMEALQKNPHLAAGLNIHKGSITHKMVAEALNDEYLPVSAILDASSESALR